MKSVFVHIVFDFDAAIGQLNATYPYNFSIRPIFEEIENVKEILDIADFFDFKFTFAITGFSAEEGVYPFNIGNLIKAIYKKGHEIASHTWRHEWLPTAQTQQIYKTLRRSKYILEECIGEKNSVIGFVPPHNRPMSWYRKGAFSLGDRGVYPFYKGADLGSLLRICGECGYRWVRVVYRPIWNKIFPSSKSHLIFRPWVSSGPVMAIPLNYNGFDAKAIEVVDRAISQRQSVVFCGHPLMFSRLGKSESKENFLKFATYLKKKQRVVVAPVGRNPIFLAK